MTALTRRTMILGLGATALAATRLPTIGSAAQADLAGHVVASRSTGDEPVVTLFDLAAGTERALQVVARTEPVDELPPVDQLYPVLGTPYGIAAFTDVLLVVDAAAATATEITPYPGTEFSQPLGGRGLFPIYLAPAFPSDRYALLAEGSRVTCLVDLSAATAFDLAAQFAGDDPFFQAADFTPDGRLLLGSSEGVLLIDLATMEVERTLAEGKNIRMPQLSPGGGRVALAVPSGQAPEVTIRVVDLGGDEEAAPIAVVASGLASMRWVDDDRLLVGVVLDERDTDLRLLDATTGEETRLGRVPGIPAIVEVLAEGTRSTVWSKPGETTVWHLADLVTGELTPLPDLDGLVSLGGRLPRFARAVLLGPDDYTGTGEAGQRYAVLNTATGAVTTTVDRLEGQFHTIPAFAPDLRTAAIGVTGEDADALWLIDLVGGGVTTLDGYLGAQFSPDGRAFLTREVRRDAPFEIRALDGGLIRELGVFDRAWWLGRA